MRRGPASVGGLGATCTHCPHQVLLLSGGTYWCPCEDCHPGGLSQGREPKVATVGANIEPSSAVDELTPRETNDIWVDPIHQL